MARTKAKKVIPNHAPAVPVPEPAPTAKEPSSTHEGRSTSPDSPLLTHPAPNGTAAIQSKQRPHPVTELSRVPEEPEHEETIVRSQEPLYPYSVRTLKEGPCPPDTSSPRIDLHAAMSNPEPDEASLALLHSLNNETSRRVQPARHRPVGASDATTEGVDSSIIEAAEKSRTVKPIIPPGTKFLLYNGPAKEGEQEVKWELSAGQRAGYYSEKNGEGYEEGMPINEYWELAEGEGDEVADEPGHAPVVTNGTTPASYVHATPNPNIIGGFDFSDATYINRHKKYAVVEKRHRLREQEMVQWELSKLPAKISQLRALDVNVFKGKTIDEKEQYRTDMLDAAETLEKRYTAIKNVATARKENRPIDPAGHMDYLTSWHQPAVLNPVADQGDTEAGFTLPSTKKRKRYELEEDQDAGISALDWDEDEEFMIGIGSRAPVDYAYAPGHYPSNRKKVRKDDRKKVNGLNGGVPVPKKSKTNSKKKKPPPMIAVPPAPTSANGSSVTPTDSASVPPRSPPKAKTHTHASAKAKVPAPAVKKTEMCVLATVAKRLAEGRREGRDGGIPFGAPFPAGGFYLPYAGYHGEFQLPTSLALQVTPELAGSVESANTEKDAEETAPQEEPEPLVTEERAAEDVSGAVEAQKVQRSPYQHAAVVFATPANVLADYDDEPLTELSSEDEKAGPDDQDEQDEGHSSPADEDADGEGEEEGDDTGEGETVEGVEGEDEDTDSFRLVKGTRR